MINKLSSGQLMLLAMSNTDRWVDSRGRFYGNIGTDGYTGLSFPLLAYDFVEDGC